jgi:hypothetical protein
LRLKSADVAPICLDLQTGQPLPVKFELEGYLQGTHTYTVELLAEERSTGQPKIVKAIGYITVAPPTPGPRLPPLLPPIDIRLAPQPDFVLQVGVELPNTAEERPDQLVLAYYLTSRLPELRRDKDHVGQAAFSTADFDRLRLLVSQTIRQATSTQPEDLRRWLVSLGIYLYDRLFPAETAADFRSVFWQAADRIRTWLIVEDVVNHGLNWLPWELVAPYQDNDAAVPRFLGERYYLSRWVDGLGSTLYGEFPFGDLALIWARDPVRAEVEQETETRAWRQLLNAANAERISQVIKPKTSFYSLHLLRYADQISAQREIAIRGEGNPASLPTPEEEAQQATRLDLKLKRPVVTFSIMNRPATTPDLPSLDVAVAERVLPFIRAGASAIVAPWWPTSEAADRIFWQTFYDLLERQVPLGKAVWRARLAVRDALPYRPDWLAYVLFGDPRAWAYWPEESQGYSALECLSPDDPLRPGQTYTFRASLRTRPPVLYKDRLVKPTALPEEAKAIFMAPGLQTAVPEPIPMLPTDREGTVCEATIQLTPPKPGKYPLLAQLFAGDEHLKTLKLTLQVGETSPGGFPHD